jgi:hypothetical protein
LSLPYDKVTLSFYIEDIDALDAFVDEIKRSGYRSASRSALVRYALRVVKEQSMETLIAELRVHRANERLRK